MQDQMDHDGRGGPSAQGSPSGGPRVLFESKLNRLLQEVVPLLLPCLGIPKPTCWPELDTVFFLAISNSNQSAQVFSETCCDYSERNKGQHGVCAFEHRRWRS